MKKDNVFSLIDRIIVVTGGKGQLGKQYCKELLSRGAYVAVLDIDKKMGTDKENLLSKERITYIPTDITCRDSLKSALNRIKSMYGIPHGLINNAAIDIPPDAPPEETGPFETYPETSMNKIIDVNIKGTFLTCQIFGEAMSNENRGSIVNISSIYGIVSPDQRIYKYRYEDTGKPFFKPPAYSVTKSAIINFTRYLACYWAPKGVRVNTLTLGGVYNNQDKRFLEGYCSRVPLGRMAIQSEYNGAIVFLLSEASSYMTGSNLIIDGGWTAW